MSDAPVCGRINFVQLLELVPRNEDQYGLRQGEKLTTNQNSRNGCA